MSTRVQIGTVEYFLELGEIAEQSTEAIVICAEAGECEPGQAVLTEAGSPPNKYFIHAHGPVWSGGHNGESDTLRRCFKSVMSLAKEKGLRSLVFPSMSPNASHFPVESAAFIAQETVIEQISETQDLERVGFVLYDSETYQIYTKVLSDLLADQQGFTD